MNTEISSNIETKRKDLSTLIDHVMQIDVDGQNETVINCVLSRLLAELRRAEVEVLRQHILSCPGLSSNSSALHNIAMPALQDALDLIAATERKMASSLLSSHALAACITGLEDSISANSFSDSSFSCDLDALDRNGQGHGNENENGIDANSHSTPTKSTFVTTNAPPPTPEETKSSLPKKSVNNKKKSFTKKIGSFLLRNLFLDIPFAITVFFFCSCLCAKHIYFTFWEPVLESVQWNRQRMDTEYTNYKRLCDVHDISTTNVDDIIIDPETMTAEDAMEVTNKHGMSIFPNVVTKEAAEEMRNWVLHRNANLSEKDEIPLISQQHRWSFPIGIDEVSIVLFKLILNIYFDLLCLFLNINFCHCQCTYYIGSICTSCHTPNCNQSSFTKYYGLTYG